MDIISLDIKTRRGVALVQTRLFDINDISSPLIGTNSGADTIVNLRESSKKPSNTSPLSIVPYVVDQTLSQIAVLAGSIFIGTVVSVKGRAKSSIPMGFNIKNIAGTVNPVTAGSSFLYQESTDPDLVEYVVSETPAAILAQVTTDIGDGVEHTINKNATGGYVGLTLFKINFKNALNTFISFFTNANTAARTYTFQDKDGTIADLADVATKMPLSGVGSMAIVQIACSDETTPFIMAASKMTFRVPQNMTLTEVRASLTTPQTSGSLCSFGINQDGVSILSTPITIDLGEKTSKTAATPAVISTSALTDDSEITIDINEVGDGTAAGLKITLIGTKA